MKIALSLNGLYAAAEGGGDDKGDVHFNRPTIGLWETFTVYQLGEGYVALQTSNGRFLSVPRPSLIKTILANRTRKSDLQTNRPELRTVPDDVFSLPHDAWEALNWSMLDTLYAITVVEADPVVAPPLQGLRKSGWDIITEDGQRWVQAGMTNFMLFQRFLEGQDIEPLLYEGAEVYRVTGTMSYVPSVVGLRTLWPQNYSNYWTGLDSFATYLASKRKRFEFTALCDMRSSGLDFNWQRRFVDQAAEVLRPHKNVLFELANEPQHATNQVDYNRFSKPEGLFASRGSSLGGDKCPVPSWDYSTVHTPRDGAPLYLDIPPIYMITGYAGYEGVHGPCTVNEPIGADEVNKPGSRSNDPQLFFRIGRMMSAWNGGTFHSTDAVFSRPLGPVQEQCREAFFKGLLGPVQP